MFDPEEREALIRGARLAADFGGEALVRPARSAIGKVEATLPPRLQEKLVRPPLYVPSTGASRAVSTTLLAVREAMNQKTKLALRYRREDGEESSRVVRPLGAFFWGTSWTVAAWCEHRSDFRNFRLDRIQELSSTRERFRDEPGRTLRDYLRRIGEFAERLLDT